RARAADWTLPKAAVTPSIVEDIVLAATCVASAAWRRAASKPVLSPLMLNSTSLPTRRSSLLTQSWDTQQKRKNVLARLVSRRLRRFETTISRSQNVQPRVLIAAAGPRLHVVGRQ